MGSATAATVVKAPERSVLVRGRRYVVRPPSARDPRLHLAATITTLHVLGQVHFGFAVSVAQILVVLATCGGAEVVMRFLRDQEIAWPANGLLMGNGIAFLLRVEGTVPGETWSMRGAWIFAGTGALAVGVRYLVRVGGRPLLNPSNVALVVCFLALGSRRVNPLDLWWAPMSPAMVVAYGVLAVGGLAVTWRTGTWPAAAAFFTTFAGLNAAVARTGHCMEARWHLGPVCDAAYWRLLSTSPEILLFGCFMITDPRTTPRGRVGRVVHGALVAVLAAGLAATQSEEFGTKVAVLGSLTVVCALRPALDRSLPPAGAPNDRVRLWLAQHRDGRRPVLGVVRAATATMCAVSAAVGLASLGGRVDASLRPLDPATDELVELTSAVVLPPLEVHASLASVGRSTTDADTMARDVLAALRAIDDAVDGRDATTVRALVSRRYLDELEPRIGAGNPDQYRFRLLAVGVWRALDDPQAPPRLVVHGVGVRGDGAEVDRLFPVAQVGGRWIVDGDLDAGSADIAPDATR